jgi:hypothetical protein
MVCRQKSIHEGSEDHVCIASEPPHVARRWRFLLFMQPNSVNVPRIRRIFGYNDAFAYRRKGVICEYRHGSPIL